MPDADDLDGCEAVQDNEQYDDDETASLRPLFPNGDADARLADQWGALFGPDRPEWRDA